MPSEKRKGPHTLQWFRESTGRPCPDRRERRYSQASRFDEQPQPELNSEAIGFRAASVVLQVHALAGKRLLQQLPLPSPLLQFRLRTLQLFCDQLFVRQCGSVFGRKHFVRKIVE